MTDDEQTNMRELIAVKDARIKQLESDLAAVRADLEFFERFFAKHPIKVNAGSGKESEIRS